MTADIVQQLRDWDGRSHIADIRGFCGSCSTRMPCDWALILDEARRAADEIELLRLWKMESLVVLDQWEIAWETAGKPGDLGESKSKGMLDEIERLREALKDIGWRSRQALT